MLGKRIQVDKDTLVKLTDLGRRRMSAFQELVDESLCRSSQETRRADRPEGRAEEERERARSKTGEVLPRKRGARTAKKRHTR